MKSMLRATARQLGAHHVWRRRNGARLLICCYHGLRVDDDAAHHWLLIPERQFVAQMEYLRRYYRCLPLDEGLAQLRGAGLDGPTACVTFDDGYRSNRTLAHPILDRLGIPATVYLATGFVNTNAVLWTTAIEHAITQSEPGQLDLRDWHLGTVSVGPNAGAAARRLVGQLKTLTADRRREVLGMLRDRLHEPRVPQAFQFMTWEDVVWLERTGLFSIGAHTVHHEILSRLADSEVRAEVRQSIDEVRRRVSRPATTFAYPNGGRADFDARACAALADAGCDYAVTTIEGFNDPSTDSFALRRVVIGGNDNLDTFRLRSAGVLPAARG